MALPDWVQLLFKHLDPGGIMSEAEAEEAYEMCTRIADAEAAGTLTQQQAMQQVADLVGRQLARKNAKRGTAEAAAHSHRAMVELAWAQLVRLLEMLDMTSPRILGALLACWKNECRARGADPDHLWQLARTHEQEKAKARAAEAKNAN